MLMVVLEGLPGLKKERAMSLLVSGFVPTLVVRKVRKPKESGWWTAGDVWFLLEERRMLTTIMVRSLLKPKLMRT